MDALQGWEVVAAAGVLGLLIGSFLNVVIHRLPIMLERQWAAECAQMSGQPAPVHAPLNLTRPRSRCPHCGKPVAWHHNVPVLGYLLLRGRCAHCSKPIGWRYPAVELLTGVLFTVCALRWGASVQTLVWSGFAACVVALAAIDWDTTLLPDDLTLPLIWAGLVTAALGLQSIGLSDAVWGAVAGYLSLWSIFWGFKLLTGKEGMGYGDFKLFAALGAWMGWQALVPVLLLASVVGSIVGITLQARGALRAGGVMPFGPFLALGGLSAMIIGPQRVLSWIGM